jgi:hypothetical protein
MSKDAIALLAPCFAGLTAGSLLFGSAVDVPTLLALQCSEKDKKKMDNNATFLKGYFPIWWPLGAKLMIPLTIFSIISSGYNYVTTKNPLWVISGGIVFAIL